MGVRRLGRDTTSVDGLVWDGRGFGDPTADAMWERLAGPLRQIAQAELQAGNNPTHILCNESRGIALLAFAQPPFTAPPRADVAVVHSNFARGNYCYDGTLCTYEDIGTGCLLAFDDPNYAGDAD